MQAKYAMNSYADSFSFLSFDNLRDLMDIIKTYPKATNESNIELLKEYRAGNVDALALLIKTNLRLLVRIGKKYLNLANSYTLLDLIQEGSIGFLAAVDSFDFEGTARFSTYAATCARNCILTALRSNDENIRRPGNVYTDVIKYRKLLYSREASGQEPLSDEETRKELNLTKRGLETVKNDAKFNPVSLDAKVNDDDETSDFSNFVSDGTNISGSVIDDITQKELFVYLKQMLSPYHYYILMMRAFKKVPRPTLATIFGVKHQAIAQTEKRAYAQVRQLVGYDRNFEYKFDKRLSVHEFEIRDVAPIQPDDVVRYMFFRDLLTPVERDLFKLYIKGDYIHDDNVFAEMLELEFNEYLRVKQSLYRKTTNMTPELEEAFKLFRTTVMKTYGTRIFTVDWDAELDTEKLNARYVAKVWDGMTYNQVISILDKQGITVNHQMDVLLRRYFDHNSKNPSYGDLRKAEREVNSLLFGFKKKNNLPLDKLYKVLEEHKDEFTDEQYMYLMMKVFNRISRRAFVSKYPKSPLLNNGGFYIIMRLEAMYFGITSYRELNFSSKKYSVIRDLCLFKMSASQTDLLDLYYGVTKKKKSIQEMADLYGLSYDEMRFKIYRAKETALSIYLDKSRKRSIEYDYYIPYVENKDIDLNDLHRALLNAFLVQRKSYEEISKEFNMSRHNVSSNILDGLMKIDFYRFGILNKDKYSDQILSRALGSPLFTPVERRIIKFVQETGSRQLACERWNELLHFDVQKENLQQVNGSVEEKDKKKEPSKVILRQVDGLMSKYTSICYLIK